MRWGNKIRIPETRHPCMMEGCRATLTGTLPACEVHWKRIPLGIRAILISPSSVDDFILAFREAKDHIRVENIRMNRLREARKVKRS